MSEASLHERLRALGLAGAADGLDDLVSLATKKRWGVTQIFEHVADIEERERTRRGLERRLSRSKLGRFKTIADYDWNWPTKIDRSLVEAAVGLHFLGGARNVVLVAPQGLGKTMIAENIAHQAIVAGHSVLFITAAKMLLDLGGQETSRALERRLAYYAKHYGVVGRAWVRICVWLRIQEEWWKIGRRCRGDDARKRAEREYLQKARAELWSS